MIFGDLLNWDKEKSAFSTVIDRGIEYLRNTDFTQMENGTYEIEGMLMHAIVLDLDTHAKSPAQKAENHIDYVDIQYVVQGEEIIGFARQSAKQIVTDDLTDADAYLYGDLHNEIDLKLHAGNFAIFFPDDIHRPGCMFHNEMTIRKVVIKIHKSLFNQAQIG